MKLAFNRLILIGLLLIALLPGVVLSVFSSPQLAYAAATTETLYPDGVGDYTNISSQSPGSGYHWDKVDEAVADDDTTYIYTNSLTQQKDASIILLQIKRHCFTI